MDYKRIPGEPEDDYKRFVEFAKLPQPRSLKQLIPKTGMSLQQLKRRCKKWDWIKRAAIYNSTALERTLEGELKGMETAAKKGVISTRKKIDTLIDLAWELIKEYIEQKAYTPNGIAKLFVDLLRLGISKEELYVKLEEHRQAADLSMLTDQQLAALDEINEAIKVE
jgi:hypothetical protein